MFGYVLAFFIVTGSLVAVSIKWELNKRISTPWALIMGSCACLVIAITESLSTPMSLFAQLILATAIPAFLTLIAMIGLFFRDPKRTLPIEKDIIISPADGFVRYVKDIQGNEFPFALKNGRKIPLSAFAGMDLLKNGGVQVGITMTFLDVHVTRAPIGGGITYLKKIPGKFRSLKKLTSLLENERVVGRIQGSDSDIGIVLIASRLVRRIVMRVDEGQSVAMGQKIGVIRFGSQADLLIPKSDSLRIRVSPGVWVKAGETIIADI